MTERKNDNETDRIRVPAHLFDADPREPCLAVLSGLETGRVIKLSKQTLLIGRGPQCDLRLREEGVSRAHARVLVTGGREPLLQDLGSTNGTFVNGRRTRVCALQDGDRVRIGVAAELKFSLLTLAERELCEQLRDGAMRDVLTCAFNRAYFDQELTQLLSLARRHRQPLSVLSLDVDTLHTVNESLGRAAGDAILKRVAERCQATLRAEDLLARVTGERFAVIARSTSEEAAAILGERLRATIADSPFEAAERQVSITISVGVAGLKTEHALPSSLLLDADRALRQAKALGRNRVSRASVTST